MLTNEEKIKKVLNEVKSKHESAKSAFNYSLRKIEQINSRPINIFYDNWVGVIKDAVETSLEGSRKYYEICQKSVFVLHEICEPLVTDETDYILVRKIADEIYSLNDDSDIDCNYTGSFQGISFGEVADLHFLPSDKAKKIEILWKNKADKAKKIADDNAYIKKHNISASDIIKHKKYEEAKKLFSETETSIQMGKVKKSFSDLNGYLDSEKYIKKCDEKTEKLLVKEEEEERIRKQKEEEQRLAFEEEKKKQRKEIQNNKKYVESCRDKVEEFKDNLLLQVEKETAFLKEDIQEKMEQIVSEIQTHEQVLESLGFLKFSQKKVEREILFKLQQQKEYLQSGEPLSKQIAEWKESVKQATTQYRRKVESYLNKKYYLKENDIPKIDPKKVNIDMVVEYWSSKGYSNKEGNWKLAFHVLDYMEPDRLYAISELMEEVPEFRKINPLSNQYATNVITLLKNKGLVERIVEKGRAKFSLIEHARKDLFECKDIPKEKKLKVKLYSEKPNVKEIAFPEPPAVEQVIQSANIPF